MSSSWDFECRQIWQEETTIARKKMDMILMRTYLQTCLKSCLHRHIPSNILQILPSYAHYYVTFKQASYLAFIRTYLQTRLKSGLHTHIPSNTPQISPSWVEAGSKVQGPGCTRWLDSAAPVSCCGTWSESVALASLVAPGRSRTRWSWTCPCSRPPRHSEGRNWA